MYLKAFQTIFLFLGWVLHTKTIVAKNSIEKGRFSMSNTSFLGQRYDVMVIRVASQTKNIHDQFKQDKKVNKKRALKMAR